MSDISDLMDEFELLLKKYNIIDVILVNFDDDENGVRQLCKISDTEYGKCLVMTFSGKGRTLCPCCAGKEAK